MRKKAGFSPRVRIVRSSNPAPSQPRIPLSDTPTMSVSQKTVSVSGKMTRNSPSFTTENRPRATMLIWAHLEGRFSQIVPSSIGGIPEKITQRKDARIRVLYNSRFYHVFLDVAKRIPDHHFHVGELKDRVRLTKSRRGYPTENGHSSPMTRG